MKKGTKQIMGLALSIVLLIGCAGEAVEKNKAKTNIVLLHGWGTMSSEDVIMREIYADFVQKNPDIDLTLVSMPSFDSLESKAKNMLAVGKTPNIIYTGAGGSETLYAFMVEKNNAVDLMPYIENDTEFAESVSQDIIKRWQTSEGKLYTVTDVIDTKGYWYNKKIFAHAGITKLPSTWQEFSLACQKIKDWAKREQWNTVVMDFDPKKSAVLLQAMMQGGKEKTTNYPVGENLLDFYQNLKNLKHLMQENEIVAVENTYKDPLFSFKIGHSAIYIGEVWEEKEFSSQMEVEYALFPTEGGNQTGQISTGSGYIISNWGDKDQQEAGIRFLKYMLSHSVQLKILKEIGRIPSNPQIDIALIKDSRKRLYDSYCLIKDAKYRKETPENSWEGYMYRKFVEYIPLYMKGEIKEEDLIYEMVENKGINRINEFSTIQRKEQSIYRKREKQ